MKKIPWKFLIPAVLLVALDQLVKYWTVKNVVLGQSLGIPFPGIFEIKLAYNYGIAFGLMEGKGVYFAPVAVVIAGYATYWCIKNSEETTFTYVTVGMLVAGAVGNLIDRVVAGKVTDMFWFRLINFPVFNIADACITISAVLLFVRSLKTSNSTNDEVPKTSSSAIIEPVNQLESQASLETKP